MRKSKYLIAGVAAVALSVAVSSAAQAATFQGQSLVVTPSSGAQDKKTPGPINSLFDGRDHRLHEHAAVRAGQVRDQHEGVLPDGLRVQHGRSVPV